jgi:hypothetical protein
MGRDVKLPVLGVPGMHDDVIAVAVGYGRDKGVGNGCCKHWCKCVSIVSKDANGNASYYASAIELSNTGSTYELAITQTHHSYQNDRPIIREFTLEEFQKRSEANYITNEKKLYGTLPTSYDHA